MFRRVPHFFRGAKMNSRLGIFSIACATAILTTTAANAHTGTGLGTGFLHPLSGLDHLLALLAVGIWAGRAGGKKLWALPASFVILMATGAVLAIGGVVLPGVESAIFASVAILILLASIATRLNAVLAAAITGVFAMFHGAAHGMEMAVAAPISYIAGFLAASVLIMAAGAAFGAAIERIRLSLVASD